MIAEAAATKEATATHALAARCAKAGLQSAVSFMLWTETTMLAGEALSDARAAVRAATDDVEARHSDWSSAASRVAALEHLDERGRETHTVEQRREETKIADDIVMTRWERS
jgi:flagellar export protein FliJ